MLYMPLASTSPSIPFIGRLHVYGVGGKMVQYMSHLQSLTLRPRISHLSRP